MCLYFKLLGVSASDKYQGINGSVIPGKAGIDATYGNLSVGYGCKGNYNLIGPEYKQYCVLLLTIARYGFGFGMNKALNGEKFVIFKTGVPISLCWH